MKDFLYERTFSRGYFAVLYVFRVKQRDGGRATRSSWFVVVVFVVFAPLLIKRLFFYHSINIECFYVNFEGSPEISLL